MNIFFIGVTQACCVVLMVSHVSVSEVMLYLCVVAMSMLLTSKLYIFSSQVWSVYKMQVLTTV